MAAQDQDGSTPLHLASERGHLDLARLLVEHGANVAAQDQDESTPLHLASEGGRLDLARLLVEHGANVAAQDQDGSTPLRLASKWGQHDLVGFLVEHAANQGGLRPRFQERWVGPRYEKNHPLQIGNMGSKLVRPRSQEFDNARKS